MFALLQAMTSLLVSGAVTFQRDAKNFRLFLKCWFADSCILNEAYERVDMYPQIQAFFLIFYQS